MKFTYAVLGGGRQGTAAAYDMSQLDRTDHLYMWNGGNDQHPKPPFNYICTFNIAGLTNEYYGEAVFLRDGKVTRVPTFQPEDYEEIEFPEPVKVKGVDVVPRDVFHACVGPKITATEEDRDLVIVRVKAVGGKDGKAAEALVEVIDYYDEATGFTAMERTTGWHGAIVAIMNARGQTTRGVKLVETGVPAQLFVDEMKKRGLSMTEEMTFP